jgi:hypothetical protein
MKVTARGAYSIAAAGPVSCYSLRPSPSCAPLRSAALRLLVLVGPLSRYLAPELRRQVPWKSSLGKKKLQAGKRAQAGRSSPSAKVAAALAGEILS